MQAAEVQTLLEETVARYVDPAARVARVQELSIDAGMSGAAVRRYELTLDGVPADRTHLRLVTKAANLIERRTLLHLCAQGQPNVPFTHTQDLTSDASALICMQDLGNIRRPPSLESIPEIAFQREAQALAAIHSANMGRADLTWLPRADRSYYARIIDTDFWRPHWERAIADPEFRRLFAQDLARIEAAAEGIVEEMAALHDAGDALTLIHTDVNPSNVLLMNGVPYIIDWQSAHYGSLYLDVPHHFFTPELAEHYRTALAMQGITISPTDFAQRFRVAARYTALRYMWWTLEAWKEDPDEEIWVRHYFAMI